MKAMSKVSVSRLIAWFSTRSLGQTPLFQVLFNHQRRDIAGLAQRSGLGFERLELTERSAQFDLVLDTEENTDGVVHVRLLYAAERFEHSTIERLGAHWLQVLKQLVAGSDTALGGVQLNSATERQQLAQWSAVQQHFPAFVPVSSRIAAQAALRPDAVAIRHQGVSLCYAELASTIADADPDFDIELTGFMEDEIRKLMEEGDNPEQELETIPRMECQAFEHHDYLVFMFHDLRDWMQVLQLIGVREVDYSINRRTKKIGIGRVLHGKRLIELCRRASMAGIPPLETPAGDPVPEPQPLDHQPSPVPNGDAAGPRGSRADRRDRQPRRGADRRVPGRL